ncbi:MAG TPA: glycosyltransferase [Cytophagales bacterium]|nr:glycosyltransferase [Cytophagales bacterium]
MLKILCVGPIWRGSNANGMFDALSRIGHIIHVVDENYFINLSQKSFFAKAIAKLSRSIQIQEFNNEIHRQAQLLKPDVVLVYKGAYVKPETIITLKQKYLIVNFYPDVSFHTHGGLLLKTLPLYHHIFTTKTFGITDLKNQFGYTQATFIPHGYDPTLHRPLTVPDNLKAHFNCDASFIGGWSDKKEELVSEIKTLSPHMVLKIWGGRWHNSTSNNLKESIQHTGIHGDLYVLGINASKINLGIVHEQVKGASSGDLITSRTFHIPGSGGFMIHEHNEESVLYFKEDVEAVFYRNKKDLAEKVKYYLSHDTEREKIRQAGHQRAVSEHSLDKRAQRVVDTLNSII